MFPNFLAQRIAHQASSYKQAIRILKEIEKEELAYNHAQKLIEELSQNIYKLAQEQAEKGQLNLAIQSIDLIPDNSQIYSIAQETKINWQKRLNQ